jgi:tRNA (guanine37-N1)-methyltransferase
MDSELISKKIGIITLFPEMFNAISEFGITSRALKRGLIELSYWNPRDFARDKHKTVDDRPFGGGPGMVMSVYPLRDAIQAAKAKWGQTPWGLTPTSPTTTSVQQGQTITSIKTIYVSPQGKPFTQKTAERWASSKESLLFVAGRYEGVDERLLELEVDEEWSIGDYVLTGGELPIMVMIDALTRLIPGAVGHEDSALQDSFSGLFEAQGCGSVLSHDPNNSDLPGLLDCPHYTRPETINSLKVPSVLLSGDHQAIANWRLKQRLGRTFLRRPDILEALNLDKNQRKLLQEFLNEHRIPGDL